VTFLLIAAIVAAWGSGFATCIARHRQRGLEVDALDVVIPDHPGELVE